MLTEEELEKLRAVFGLAPPAPAAQPPPPAAPGGGPPSAIMGPPAGSILQRTSTGLTWVSGGAPVFGGVDTRQAESPPTQHDCSFCGLTSQTVKNAKTGWEVCGRERCGKAEKAQTERMYAGLVDCEQTRRDALRWVEAQ